VATPALVVFNTTNKPLHAVMKSRFHKGLLMGSWLAMLAIIVFSIFRSDPMEANWKAGLHLVKSQNLSPSEPPAGESEQPPLSETRLRLVNLPKHRIVWPLVLQEIPELSPAQEAAKIRVMEDFIEKVGGEDQDGSDPAYRDRWLALQPQADQQFRVLIGQEAFAACEMRIAQAANSASAAEQ